LLDEPIKEAYLLTDAAIPDSYNLYSTITERVQKYIEELIRIWQLKTFYKTPLVLPSMGIIPNKLYDGLNLFNLHPALYILMQKSVILNT
jgi:hypothetical protein